MSLDQVSKVQANFEKFDELKTEWSPEFERLFRESLNMSTVMTANRVDDFLSYCQQAMVVSRHKYGLVSEGYGPGEDRSAVGSIPARVERYVKGGWRGDVKIKPGNTEWLTDVYNFAMIEFMCPHEPLSVLPPSIFPPGGVSGILCAVDQFYAAPPVGEPVRPVYLLVLAAKFAFQEFADPQHPGAHFKGTEYQSPGRLNLEEDGEHFLSEHSN